jgi:hypothetical protein
VAGEVEGELQRWAHPGECTWMVVMAEDYYRLVDLQTDRQI